MATWDVRDGSCLHTTQGLASLADLSIDHAFYDSPYSAHVHSSFMHGITATNKVGKRGKFAEKSALGFNSLSRATLEGTAEQLARVVRRWIGAFSDVESCHLWREAFERYGLEYVRTVLWDKLGGAPQFTGDRPAVAFECIVLAHRPGKKIWNGGGKRGLYEVPWNTSDIYTHSIVLAQRGKETRAHTTQKPEALMDAILRDFTDAGETVLDPFAGSGTTGVAALRLGRNFLGWEIDPAMAEAARQRLSTTYEVLPLFAQKPSKFVAMKLALDATGVTTEPGAGAESVADAAGEPIPLEIEALDPTMQVVEKIGLPPCGAEISLPAHEHVTEAVTATHPTLPGVDVRRTARPPKKIKVFHDGKDLLASEAETIADKPPEVA